MPLTDTAIKKAKPADVPQKLSDGGGLFLLITPKGGKWWRFRYRFDGKQKELSQGTYPEISLAVARQRRDEARRLVAEGVDPGEERKAAKREEAIQTSNSFEAVAREWIETQRPRWTARHADYTTRRLELDIFSAIGHRPIHEIKPMELLAALKAMEERGTTDLPNRVRAVVAQVFKYAIITERCDRNPAADLQGALKAHVVTHQKALDREELPELLQKIEGYDTLAGGDLQTKLALKLLALTFVRTSEMRMATWEEFDMEAREWRIPGERMKMRAPHVVPLSHQAMEVIDQLRLLNGSYKWVFAGRLPTRPMSENTALFALYRLGYRGRMTGHGFRAVASTILNEMGFRGDVIERQLAHKEANETRAAYHRSQYMDERKKMMQWWADFLDELKAGTVNILPFKRQA